MKVGFIVLRIAAFAFGLGITLPALAQEPPTDWCGAPLSVQADPGTAMLWRLRCTIQILDQERMEAVNHATFVVIDKAVAEAKLKEALLEVAGLKKEKEEAASKETPAQKSPAPPPAAVLPPHKDK